MAVKLLAQLDDTPRTLQRGSSTRVRQKMTMSKKTPARNLQPAIVDLITIPFLHIVPQCSNK